ncbi:site-specific integrase [Chryseolinea sp. H1M3-3]|uniref:tyrosine-type recombinase/integrase n=1 Tax=Chryseolinea sp. H1M3-3 TaxID=3034144 RepID=UPI0023EAF84E|nr:site-specific integrase [Chryseolinea sp. H1M3-3]
MLKTRINLTKEYLDNYSIPKHGRVYLYDTKERGLVAQITTKGGISFYLYKKVHGRPERFLLGRYPDTPIAKARTKALVYKTMIAEKKNPRLVDPSLRGEMTFGQLFDKYLTLYSKPHKKSWEKDEKEINRYVSHWKNRKLSSITNDEVTRLHKKIGSDNGKYQANRLLERIRSIHNKGIRWGNCLTNPAIGIDRFPEKSRDRFIQPDEMPRFIEALSQEKNKTVQDYFWILLLTGARRTNAIMMRWEDLNFNQGVWLIPETKNGESVTVPLVTRAVELLKSRQKISEWVFPSVNDKSKPFDPEKGWRRILKRSGLKDLRIHDLRRTFGSYQAISGTSLQIIGKSLGHKSQEATKVYARLNLDPVRASIEKATEVMFGR